MYNEMYKNFKMMFPLIERKVVDWYPCGRNELVIILNDRSRMVWNDLTQCVRNIPREDEISDNYNEESWRRRFGEKLQELMMYRGGITSQQLADAVGITRAMLSRYLNGHATPGFFVIKKMSRVLGCPVSELTEFPDFDI